MTERAQLSHVLLDVDFLHKPTVVGFRSKFTWNAIPWLVELYCLMSRATHGQVSDAIAETVALDMGLKNGSELIEYCLANRLIEREDGALINSRVVKDQEALAKKRESAFERKEKFKNKIVPNVCGTRSPDTDTDTEDLDLKKVVRLAPQPEILEIPEKAEHFSGMPQKIPRVRGGFPAKTEEFPPESAQFVDACREQLHPPDTPNIENDSRFINCGRRPMRKYPEIWLTLHDLVEARRQLDEAGIPPDKLWMVFSKVAAKLRTKIESGESVLNINPFLWLIGWAKKEALDELKSSLDLERSQNYLKKAKG